MEKGEFLKDQIYFLNAENYLKELQRNIIQNFDIK